MQKKLDLPKLWRTCTLIFAGLSIIIIKYVFGLTLWLFFPIMAIYFVINAFCFNSYFLGMIGNYYFFIKHNQTALKYYKKAIDKNTRNVMAIYNYAAEELKNGDAKSALEHLKRADKLNTSVMIDKNIMLATGSCYWVLNDIDNAIKSLEDMRKKYTYVNYHVYTTLGYFYLLKNDFEKAFIYTNKALEENPEHAGAIDNLGQIYYYQNDFENAEKYFLKAISIKENSPDSLYYLGLMYEKKGENKKAEQYLKKALSCNISSLNTITKEDIEKRLSKLEQDQKNL